VTELEPKEPLDPKLFGPNPVRDERFNSKDRWHELPNFPHDHPNSSLEFLTRQMNEEINATEMAARNLVDFPDADWGLRMAIARQAADEARHAIAFRRLLEQRGGYLGQFPVINFQFRIMMMIPSLIGRLAVANRSFEAAGIDAIQDGIDSSKRKEDLEFTSLFDQQLADEMQHVRFANVWIKKIVDREGARAMMALARAIAHANAAMKEIVGDDVVFYPVSDELRREAGFSEDEIQSARELAEQK
jgi:uncharacterized ferritin-like protein (DUF455 family)